ncbi:SixA phosphatase family protein [Pararhodonellum marinum]|uniref:SixA phosphatase family protein n=1 Tax=Pararhodonellum marinum TaxID=2755358 RepID=UPI00188E405D|nr:histidine phosphatase family protein [Pararhodonellum marinum]
MKNLVIIRHAKSAWDDPYLSDHERPLAERGLRDAPRMAQRLKKRGIFPDAMVSSTAERAKSTALITAENLHFPKEKLRLTTDLYHSGVSEIMKTIQKTPDSVATLFIFGHNPGFNSLVESLGGHLENLPTSGQFGFQFDVDSWKKIGPKNAKVWFFDYPKKS